jgi:hypothetical protein
MTSCDPDLAERNAGSERAHDERGPEHVRVDDSPHRTYGGQVRSGWMFGTVLDPWSGEQSIQAPWREPGEADSR